MLNSGQYLELFPVRTAPSFLQVILGAGTPSAAHSSRAEVLMWTMVVWGLLRIVGATARRIADDTKEATLH